jgi:UDP-N-acetylmuramoyl-tripeptide--D-alanyl-D-alanine ligase
MSAMSLSSIAEETGGQLQGEAVFNFVSTDTRTIEPGALYVALTGENFNGNRFVSGAMEKGAVAAVVSEPPSENIPHLKVADTRKALGIIARSNRRLFKGPVVALTGSAGKTTCKELVSSILQQSGAVLATRGNLNNEVGVPLTLLAIDPHHQYAVIEMGASQQGDIGYLCQFAEPDVALVTNAMPAHMQSFGSLESIARTKGEIFESLTGSGVAVINLDDPFSGQWREQAGECHVISFSTHDTAADVYARNINSQAVAGSEFVLSYRAEEALIRLPLLGAHNIANALAASAACLALGVEFGAVKAGLEHIEAVAGRLKVLKGKGGISLIDDSYNANPGAVKAAIDTLSGYDGRTCLILGNMAELGDKAEFLHREIGSYARKKGIQQMLVVGEWAEAVVEGFGEAAICFEDMESLLSGCDKYINSDVVLVKGSRSAGMERVVSCLSVDGGEQ